MEEWVNSLCERGLEEWVNSLCERGLWSGLITVRAQET